MINVVLTADECFAGNTVIVLLIFDILYLFSLCVADEVVALGVVHVVSPWNVLLILRSKITHSR